MASVEERRTMLPKPGYRSVGEGVTVIEILPTTEELLAAWREAQRALEGYRLDSPGRTQAEDRVHDARAAYQARILELEESEPAEAY